MAEIIISDPSILRRINEKLGLSVGPADQFKLDRALHLSLSLEDIVPAVKASHETIAITSSGTKLAHTVPEYESWLLYAWSIYLASGTFTMDTLYLFPKEFGATYGLILHKQTGASTIHLVLPGRPLPLRAIDTLRFYASWTANGNAESVVLYEVQ